MPPLSYLFAPLVGRKNAEKRNRDRLPRNGRQRFRHFGQTFLQIAALRRRKAARSTDRVDPLAVRIVDKVNIAANGRLLQLDAQQASARVDELLVDGVCRSRRQVIIIELRPFARYRFARLVEFKRLLKMVETAITTAFLQQENDTKNARLANVTLRQLTALLVGRTMDAHPNAARRQRIHNFHGANVF